MARTFRLGKLGLVIWLLTPVVLVAVLWTQMDRSRGKPDPRLQRAAAPHPATPHPDKSGEPAPPTPATPPATAPQGMVEPESLAQGFVLLVTDSTKRANPSSPIHLASSHNGWSPSDPNQKLSPRSDGRWQIVMKKPSLDSRLAFKFTRGNWDTVEVSSELKDIDNRMLPMVDASSIAPGEQPVIEVTVLRWADERPRGDEARASGPHRAIKVAGGTVHRVQTVGGGVAITRDLIIWLPPGYDDAANAAREYPVLYMQDGQNLFDQPRGNPPEWRVDETAIELIKDGRVEPFIIVGIPHAGTDRAAEYLPTAAIDDIAPRGDAYVSFVINEVMPRVERGFRVRKGSAHTAIGGSSLGGLISLYAALKRSDIFGKVIAESPSLRVRGHDIWRQAFDGVKSGPDVIFMAMGGKELGTGADVAEENTRLVGAMESFHAWLAERRIGKTVEVIVDEEAGHNEAAWAARFPRALQTIFPAGK